MKIVIDIPEEVYNRCKEYRLQCGESEVLESVVARGTPLPKWHGRLIDADELEELFGKMCPSDCGACDPKRKTDGRGRWYDTCSLIDDAPTIIEADKAESEDKE